MLVPFLLKLISFSCASTFDFSSQTLILARDQSASLFHEGNPFMIVSYNAIYDIPLAHFSSAKEMLKQNLELLLFDATISYSGSKPLMVRSMLQIQLTAEELNIVHKPHRIQLALIS